MYTAKSMYEVKKNHKAVGGYFFHPITMKYWKSIIETSLFDNNTFVTSEQPEWEDVRKYTVRYYDPKTAMIDTIGEDGQFDNYRDACAFAQSFSVE